MENNYFELLDINKLRTLIEHIYTYTSIPTGILSRKGEMIISYGLNEACEKYHKINNVTRNQCKDNMREIVGFVEKTKKTYVGKCSNGMTNIGVPILVDGIHIATIFQGQFFRNDLDKDMYREISLNNGFDNEGYIDDTQFCYEKKVYLMIDFLEGLSRFIGEVAYSNSMLKKQNNQLNQKNMQLELMNKEFLMMENRLTEKINELKDKSDKLEELSNRYKLIAEGSYDVIWDIDMENDGLFVSDKIKTILDDDINLKSYRDFSRYLFEDDREGVIQKFRENILSGNYYRDEFRLVTKTGDIKYLLCQGKILRNGKNKPIKMAGSLKNITDKKEYEKKIEEMAYIDSLTGLKNRNKCILEVNKVLENIRKKKKKSLSVLFMDIDNFKNINDKYGHPLGDYILEKIARRIEKIIPDGMEIYRFGGDEFLILATDYDSIDEVNEIAEEIIDKFSRPFKVNKKEFYLTVSIGIAESKTGKTKFHKLLKNADMALNSVKESGKNDYILFTRKLNEVSMKKMTVEEDLYKAIANNELFLVFQPKINIKENKIAGFEALVRWKHPVKGIVYPNDFIEIAESNGFIRYLDNWVYQSIIDTIIKLEDKGVEYDSISFNISPKTLMHYSTINSIDKGISSFDFDPGKIKIEITENVMMNSEEKALKTLEKLKKLGFVISMDDFGRGYSSLNYLRMLPIDELKIDKSFISSMDFSEYGIIDLIIDIAHRMGLKIIAEGVEKYNQYKYLRDNDCDIIQGFYMSKPIKFEEIELFCEAFK